MAMEDLTVRLK